MRREMEKKSAGAPFSRQPRLLLLCTRVQE